MFRMIVFGKFWNVIFVVIFFEGVVEVGVLFELYFELGFLFWVLLKIEKGWNLVFSFCILIKCLRVLVD